MNPFQSPTTSFAPSPNDMRPARRGGPALIAVLLILASTVGILSIIHPTVRSLTMPRFGWIGLILCVNPLIFLIPWLRNPLKPALSGAAFMCLALGVINSVQLLFTGTVPVVINEFADRLHSSWLWSVLPLFIAGGYLYLHSWSSCSGPSTEPAISSKTAP